MSSNFYSTAAQVLPIILLALIWESRYLDAARFQYRRSRRDDPQHGVLFWTKQRVKVYAMIVATATIGCLMICLLVLAGLLPDLVVLRTVIVFGGILGSASLLYRIWNEIRDATSLDSDEVPPSGGPGTAPPSLP